MSYNRGPMDNWITVQVTKEADRLKMLRGATKGVFRRIAELGEVAVRAGSAEITDGRIRVEAMVGSDTFSLGGSFLDCTLEQARQIGISALTERMPYLGRRAQPAPVATLPSWQPRPRDLAHA